MARPEFPELIAKLIEKYLSDGNCGFCNDEVIKKYYGELSIEDCIIEATNRGRFEVNDQEVFDSHYDYFQKADLEASKKILLDRIQRLKLCKTFSEVYDIVKETHRSSSSIENLAYLYYYDTSFRIACSREINCSPVDVYVHSGALYGAQLLFRSVNLTENKRYIPKRDFEGLSPAFKKLSAYQIESFLCVMHGELERLMGKLDNFKTIYKS